MLCLNIQIFNFILNFKIDDLCCVILEFGELFGILILVNFGIILFGSNFLLKYIVARGSGPWQRDSPQGCIPSPPLVSQL